MSQQWWLFLCLSIVGSLMPCELTRHLSASSIVNATTLEVVDSQEINITVADTTKWHLQGLEEGSLYRFLLSACTRAGCGPPLAQESSTIASACEYEISVSGAIVWLKRYHLHWFRYSLLKHTIAHYRHDCYNAIINTKWRYLYSLILLCHKWNIFFIVRELIGFWKQLYVFCSSWGQFVRYEKITSDDVIRDILAWKLGLGVYKALMVYWKDSFHYIVAIGGSSVSGACPTLNKSQDIVSSVLCYIFLPLFLLVKTFWSWAI